MQLAPTTARTLNQAADIALDGVRRRPVVAINDDGQLVVCCKRTAQKHGWKLEGKLFTRPTKAQRAA